MHYRVTPLHPQTIVIYNTGAIGDLLVSTAALRSIAVLYPNAAQTLIGNSIWKNILLPSEWPQIVSFVECERKSLRNAVLYKPNLQNNTWEKVHPIFSLPQFLSAYSMGISLRNRSVRFALALMRARVKIRVGAHRSWWARFFYTHFSIEPQTPVRERDRHLNVLLSLDKDFVAQQKEYWNIHGLPGLKKEYDRQKFNKKFGERFILINPTASIREKAWDAKNFKTVVDALVLANKNPVVVGAPNETEWLQEVAASSAPIYQATSIFNICDLIAAASLFVTNTSSLQFIAASTGTRTITLMGCAKPEVWGPLGRNDILIRAQPQAEDEKIQKDRTLNKTERGKKLEKVTYARISVEQVLDTINEVSNQRN